MTSSGVDTYTHNACLDKSTGLVSSVSRWDQFDEKVLTKALMKPSARKTHDYVFNVFHQLNLKDAASYVAEVSPPWLLLGPDSPLTQGCLCRRENAEAHWSSYAMKLQSSISGKSLMQSCQTCCPKSLPTCPTTTGCLGERNNTLFCPLVAAIKATIYTQSTAAFRSVVRHFRAFPENNRDKNS